MFDWFSWGMGLIQGIVTGAISGVILLLFILPKMGAKTATQTLHAAKKDPEIGPLISKTQEILHALEPLAKQFKNIDLNKLQEEFKPFIEAIKKIKPEDIEALMKALRELTGTVQKAIEKPKIPEPD